MEFITLRKLALARESASERTANAQIEGAVIRSHHHK
jgi:hypothetical protein